MTLLLLLCFVLLGSILKVLRGPESVRGRPRCAPEFWRVSCSGQVLHFCGPDAFRLQCKQLATLATFCSRSLLTGFDMSSLCSESAASDHKGDKEEQKLEFTLKALESPDPFEQHAQLPADVTEAMYWQAARSPEEVIGEREVIMQRLEAADRVMRKNGLCDKWLEGADLEVKRVAASVNGIILEDLCRSVKYADSSCVDLFRHGHVLGLPGRYINVSVLLCDRSRFIWHDVCSGSAPHHRL